MQTEMRIQELSSLFGLWGWVWGGLFDVFFISGVLLFSGFCFLN